MFRKPEPEPPLVCGERFYPVENALTATLTGYVCTRERGHPPPHRRGPKVYCGAIYRRPAEGLFYCNLDKDHRGLHGREPVTAPPTPSRLERFWAWLRG